MFVHLNEKKRFFQKQKRKTKLFPIRIRIPQKLPSGGPPSSHFLTKGLLQFLVVALKTLSLKAILHVFQ